MAQKPYKTKAIQPMNPEIMDVSPELDELQEFMPLSAEDRERLKKDIQAAGEIRDPIKVYFDKKGVCRILGGRNRWEISRELGWDLVPVEVYDLKPAQRRELAIMDSLARRHLTREQKRKIVEMFLKNDSELSNSAISKKVGVDDKTVGKVRRDLESTSEIPKLEKRKGADGRVRKSTPAREKRSVVEDTPSPSPSLDEAAFKSTPKGKGTRSKKSGEDSRQKRVLLLDTFLDYADDLLPEDISKIALDTVDISLGKLKGDERAYVVKELKKVIKRYQ